MIPKERGFAIEDQDMKRSALFHSHERSGAMFGLYDGWQLPSLFSTREAEAALVTTVVGLGDVSYRVKFETATEPARNGWRLGDGRFLIIGDPPLATPPGGIDVTSVYANLLLAGPRSRDVLAKVSSLDTSDQRLPNSCVAQASVAHVHCIVLRSDLPQVPAYHLLVARDYAESFWEALLHAGQEFPLRPFGLEALERLRG
jgi:glycine cleavage system aminomethyltransferase T